MIIKTQQGLFNKNNCYRELNKLFEYLESGKHELYLLADQENEIIDSQWFSELGPWHSNIYSEIIIKTIDKSDKYSKKQLNSRAIFEIDISDNGQYSIFNAIKTFDESLLIVVEDINSDKVFLLSLFNIFKDYKKKLEWAFKNKWLDFDHAGGKNNIVKLLENHINKWPNPYCTRLFVVIDSDLRNHVDPIAQDAKKIEVFCQANNIPLHIYVKRETENYIPETILKKKIPTDYTATTNAFCDLNPLQKDYYDLEKGFQGRRPTADDPLFGQLTEDEFNKLRNGFDDGRKFEAKKELYKYVEDDEFDISSLTKRCEHNQPTELRDLLNRITNLL